MATYKREYKSANTGKPIWGYDFSHGKRRYKKAGFLTQEDAEKAERKKHQEVVYELRRVIPRERLTFADYLPKFHLHRRVTRAEGTATREEQRTTSLLASFGNKPLSEITAGHINDYVAKRKNKDGLAPRSINLELTFLRSFFGYAVQQEVMAHNPAKLVQNLRVIQDEHWIPTREEFIRFIEAAKTVRFGDYLVPWLWFRAYTGTRPEESTFIEWQDIDFQNNRIHIRPKEGHELKNGRFRVVDIHPELRTILLEWKAKWDHLYAKMRQRYPNSKEHQWVFVHPHNHDERANRFCGSFYQARKKAHLPKMTSHTLRHYFISQCVMSGIDTFTIAKWVGHRNTKMVEEVYGHLTPDFKSEQMAKLRIVPTPTLKIVAPPKNEELADDGLSPLRRRNVPANVPAVSDAKNTGRVSA